MIIVLKPDILVKDEQDLIAWLESFGVKACPIRGADTTVIGLVGDTSVIDIDTVSTHAVVERVLKVQEPIKRANRKFHPDDTVFDVGGVTVGGGRFVVIAGPCSVESDEQLCGIARAVKDAGAAMLRGGSFKPRSSPYSFQGLKAEGLHLLNKARQQTALPIVSEITNLIHLDLFVEYVDVIQVGARNMQNFELLKALGRCEKPVLLKRGFSNTLEELLMSAEYILSGGNQRVILCERGIRTFETYTRNTLDISAVPALKRMSHLPVFVDPSHASGLSWMVEPLVLAAAAAGADGVIAEVHNDPPHALSDGPQSITPEGFAHMMKSLRPLVQALGREL